MGGCDADEGRQPDLPARWQREIELSPYDRDSFYLHGNSTPLGYTDYTFAVKA